MDYNTRCLNCGNEDCMRVTQVKLSSVDAKLTKEGFTINSAAATVEDGLVECRCCGQIYRLSRHEI